MVAGTIGTTPQPTRPGGSTPTPTSSQTRPTVTPLPTRAGEPTATPSPTPTLTPTPTPTRAPTAGTGGTAITLMPTQTASPSALPATGITGNMGIAVGIGSVSYTHLDVYKRQVL